MTTLENSLILGFGIFVLVVITIVGGAILYTFFPGRFDVSNIPDQERWNDLNNHNARDRFCQAQGYSEAKITGLIMEHESDSAGSPYGYMILCTRSVPEKRTYEYSEYKKWLIQLEITNKT